MSDYHRPQVTGSFRNQKRPDYRESSDYIDDEEDDSEIHEGDPVDEVKPIREK